MSGENGKSISRRTFLKGLAGGAALVSSAPLIGGQVFAARDYILLGSVLPLTGKESRPGLFFKKAYEMAVRDINAQGGVNVGGKKMKLKLIILDNESKTDVSVSLFERLVTVEKVDFLMGGYSSTLVFAESVVPERFRIPYLNAGGAGSKIYKRGFKWLFGTLATIKALADTQMDFLKAEIDRGALPKPLTIDLVIENTVHGNDYRDGVLEAAKKLPDYFKVVTGPLRFELHTKDFSPILEKIRGSNAMALLCDAHLTDFITMHRQFLERGLYRPVVTYGARGLEEKAKEALGVKGTNYIFAAQWWNPKIKTKVNQIFIEHWKKFAPDLPCNIWYPARAYELPWILKEAVEVAGTLDKKAVRDVLATHTFTKMILTPGGKISFPKETGQQSVHPYVILQNQPTDGGRVQEIVWPPDARTAVAVWPKVS